MMQALALVYAFETLILWWFRLICSLNHWFVISLQSNSGNAKDLM